MSDWYFRQFGDRARFAISFALGRDPHPSGSGSLDATWGALTLWVHGRCLTRNVSEDSGVSDEVRWNMLHVLQWLTTVGVRLVNEEPFPHHSDAHLRDACDWYNDTEKPFLSLTAEEEDDWFSIRSDWRYYHALRRAADDVALPNIAIRRLGDFLEVSWDNETWGTVRPGIEFVEKRGTEIVIGDEAANVLLSALRDVTKEVDARTGDEQLRKLAATAAALEACADDWKWLVHRETARAIENIPELRTKLVNHATQKHSELFVPHTSETLALRQALLTNVSEIRAFLRTTLAPPPEPLSPELRQFVAPRPAPRIRPWQAGYEYALEVRERLGWGDAPVPNLALEEWLNAQKCAVREIQLVSSISVVSARFEDKRGLAILNPNGSSLLRREIGVAASLGHLLMDRIPISVDGVWENWPTAARARAFGVMLLMPEDGVRGVLAGRTKLDTSDVKKVMHQFGTGPYATTFHLQNLKLINEERRTAILGELEEQQQAS